VSSEAVSRPNIQIPLIAGTPQSIIWPNFHNDYASADPTLVNTCFMGVFDYSLQITFDTDGKLLLF